MPSAGLEPAFSAPSTLTRLEDGWGYEGLTGASGRTRTYGFPLVRRALCSTELPKHNWCCRMASNHRSLGFNQALYLLSYSSKLVENARLELARLSLCKSNPGAHAHSPCSQYRYNRTHYSYKFGGRLRSRTLTVSSTSGIQHRLPAYPAEPSGEIDRIRTCIRRGCNPSPSHSSHDLMVVAGGFEPPSSGL